MPEIGPSIPENLTGQSPENITQLTEKLTQTLADLPPKANFRTDEMIKQDGDSLRKRLRGGLSGLGRKKVDLKEDDDLDDLWVATQIVCPTKEAALNMYLVASSALIKTMGGSTEGLTAEDVHNELIRKEEGRFVNANLLNELNSRQILHGDYAVLTLLDDLIKKDQAKEEVKESTAETGDYAVLDSFTGRNKGGRAENQDFVARSTEITPKEAARSNEPFAEKEAKRLAKGRLFVVAGGIKGKKDGVFVSEWATRELIRRFVSSEEEDPRSLLDQALTEINQQLYKIENNTAAMETTIVAALIKGHNLYITHLGHSRAYLLRNGSLQRLTKDHSLAEEHPGMNANHDFLTKSLGGVIAADFDDEISEPIPVQKGDSVLLCTDGLWGTVDDRTIGEILSHSKNSVEVDDQTIGAIVRSKNSEEAVKQLITAAVYRGGEHADNIGVAVINVEDLIKGKS